MAAIYDNVRNGSWQCLYRGKRLRPGSYSRTEIRTEGQAMKAALKRTWETEKGASGYDCPHMGLTDAIPD